MIGKDWPVELKPDGMSAIARTDHQSFTASLEDAHDLTSWRAGGYSIGSSTWSWAEKHLCRQETALLYDAGWTGLGRGAGLARCLVSFGIYMPVNLVLNVTTFLSPVLLWQVAVLRLAACCVAWLFVVCQSCFSPDFMKEIVTPHNVALGSLSALGLLSHAVLLREQIHAGRFSHARLHGQPNSARKRLVPSCWQQRARHN